MRSEFTNKELVEAMLLTRALLMQSMQRCNTHETAAALTVIQRVITLAAAEDAAEQRMHQVVTKVKGPPES